MSNSTILAYLLCCAWMSRCWTFREGALAKDWLVQFADGLCGVDDRFKTETVSSQLNPDYDDAQQELLPGTERCLVRMGSVLSREKLTPSAICYCGVYGIAYAQGLLPSGKMLFPYL
jgi:hypothetical protein